MWKVWRQRKHTRCQHKSKRVQDLSGLRSSNFSLLKFIKNKRLNRSSKIFKSRKHLAQKKYPRLQCTWMQVQSALAKFFVKIYEEKLVRKNLKWFAFLHMSSLVFTSFHYISLSLLSIIHHHQLSLRHPSNLHTDICRSV